MLARIKYLLAAFAVCLAIGNAWAQEGPPGARPPAPPAAAGVDKKYVELSHSTDPKVKGLAERYLNLVKYQEWGDASGKFTTMAKYISHDPDLVRVKLAVPKGTGKERTVKEIEVEVGKLSKVCQSRVKQIDTLQKKLDELAATAAEKGENGQGGPGRGPEGPGPGRPMADERGAEPHPLGPERGAFGPGAAPPGPGAPPQAQADAPDPSALEPDPLGFAELQPVAATLPAGTAIGPEGGPVHPPAASTAPNAGQGAGAVDRTPWRTNFAAFAANFTVRADPAGVPQIDWGELRDLREMNARAAAQQNREAPQPPEAETPASISERLGDVHWQLVIESLAPNPEGIQPRFRNTELPKPLEMQFVLDEKETAQNWSKLAPGTSVNVSARLIINEPNKIAAKVRLAGP